MNLAKYKKTFRELDEAEKRADNAESALNNTKRRYSFSKGSSSVSTAPHGGVGGVF